MNPFWTSRSDQSVGVARVSLRKSICNDQLAMEMTIVILVLIKVDHENYV